MDFLLKFLIIGGKYITRITSQSIKEAYRRTIILGNKINSDYEQTLCVPADNENILDLYNNILDEMENNPQHQMAFISEQHRQSLESYLSDVEVQSNINKSESDNDVQFNSDDMNNLRELNIEELSGINSLHKPSLENQTDTSKMTIILKPHLMQKNMELPKKSSSQICIEPERNKATLVICPKIVIRTDKITKTQEEDIIMKNEMHFKEVENRIIEEDLIRRCKLIEDNSNDLKKIAIRNLQFYTMMENRQKMKMKEEQEKQKESNGLNLIEKELMERGFWDDVDAIDKTIIKTPTSTKKQHRIKRMISRNYLDNLTKKSIEKMKTVHVEYEESKKKAATNVNAEVFFRKQTRYKKKDQVNMNKKFVKREAVDKKMVDLKNKQKQEDTKIINQVRSKFEMIKQRELEKCVNEQNNQVLNPEMQANDEVIIDQLMQNILKKEISFVRQRVTSSEMITEEIKNTAKLLEITTNHFSIVDTALRFKQLEKTIEHESSLLSINDSECKKLERQLTSKMLHIIPEKPKLQQEVLPLALEMDLKLSQVDMKERIDLLDVNQRVFNELEANIKIVKLINKHRINKLPTFAPKSVDSTRRSFSIRAHYRKLSQFAKLSRLYCTNNNDNKIVDEDEVNWENLTAFEEEKKCNNVSTNTNDLLSKRLENQCDQVGEENTYIYKRGEEILLLLKNCEGLALYNVLIDNGKTDIISSDVTLDNSTKISNIKKILSQVLHIDNKHIVKVTSNLNTIDLQNVVLSRPKWYTKNSIYAQNRLNKSGTLEDNSMKHSFKHDFVVETKPKVNNLNVCSKLNPEVTTVLVDKLDDINNNNISSVKNIPRKVLPKTNNNMESSPTSFNKLNTNITEQISSETSVTKLHNIGSIVISKKSSEINDNTIVSKPTYIELTNKSADTIKLKDQVQLENCSNIAQKDDVKIIESKFSLDGNEVIVAPLKLSITIKPSLDKVDIVHENKQSNQIKLDSVKHADKDNDLKLKNIAERKMILGITLKSNEAIENKIEEANAVIKFNSKENKLKDIKNDMTLNYKLNATKPVKLPIVKAQSESNLKKGRVNQDKLLFKPFIVQGNKSSKGNKLNLKESGKEPTNFAIKDWSIKNQIRKDKKVDKARLIEDMSPFNKKGFGIKNKILVQTNKTTKESKLIQKPNISLIKHKIKDCKNEDIKVCNNQTDDKPHLIKESVSTINYKKTILSDEILLGNKTLQSTSKENKFVETPNIYEKEHVNLAIKDKNKTMVKSINNKVDFIQTDAMLEEIKDNKEHLTESRSLSTIDFKKTILTDEIFLGNKMLQPTPNMIQTNTTLKEIKDDKADITENRNLLTIDSKKTILTDEIFFGNKMLQPTPNKLIETPNMIQTNTILKEIKDDKADITENRSLSTIDFKKTILTDELYLGNKTLQPTPNKLIETPNIIQTNTILKEIKDDKADITENRSLSTIDFKKTILTDELYLGNKTLQSTPNKLVENQYIYEKDKVDIIQTDTILKEKEVNITRLIEDESNAVISKTDFDLNKTILIEEVVLENKTLQPNLKENELVEHPTISGRTHAVKDCTNEYITSKQNKELKMSLNIKFDKACLTEHESPSTTNKKTILMDEIFLGNKTLQSISKENQFIEKPNTSGRKHVNAAMNYCTKEAEIYKPDKSLEKNQSKPVEEINVNSVRLIKDKSQIAMEEFDLKGKNVNVYPNKSKIEQSKVKLDSSKQKQLPKLNIQENIVNKYDFDATKENDKYSITENKFNIILTPSLQKDANVTAKENKFKDSIKYYKSTSSGTAKENIETEIKIADSDKHKEKLSKTNIEEEKPIELKEHNANNVKELINKDNPIKNYKTVCANLVESQTKLDCKQKKLITENIAKEAVVSKLNINNQTKSKTKLSYLNLAKNPSKTDYLKQNKSIVESIGVYHQKLYKNLNDALKQSNLDKSKTKFKKTDENQSESNVKDNVEKVNIIAVIGIDNEYKSSDQTTIVEQKNIINKDINKTDALSIKTLDVDNEFLRKIDNLEDNKISDKKQSKDSTKLQNNNDCPQSLETPEEQSNIKAKQLKDSKKVNFDCEENKNKVFLNTNYKILEQIKPNLTKTNSAMNLSSKESKPSNDQKIKHKQFYIINESSKDNKTVRNSLNKSEETLNKSENKKHIAPNMDHIKYLSSSSTFIDNNYNSTEASDKSLQQNIIIDLINDITNTDELIEVFQTDLFKSVDDWKSNAIASKTQSEANFMPHSYWCFPSDHKFYNIGNNLDENDLKTVLPDEKLPCGNEHDINGDEERIVEDDINQGDFSWLNYAIGAKHSDNTIISNEDELVPAPVKETEKVEKNNSKHSFKSSKDCVLSKFLPCEELVPEHLKKNRVGLSVFNLENTVELNPILFDYEIGERFRIKNKKSPDAIPIMDQRSKIKSKSETKMKYNMSAKSPPTNENVKPKKNKLSYKPFNKSENKKHNLSVKTFVNANIMGVNKSESRIPKVEPSKTKVSENIDKSSITDLNSLEGVILQLESKISDIHVQIPNEIDSNVKLCEKITPNKTEVNNVVPSTSKCVEKIPSSIVGKDRNSDKIKNSSSSSAPNIIKHVNIKKQYPKANTSNNANHNKRPIISETLTKLNEANQSDNCIMNQNKSIRNNEIAETTNILKNINENESKLIENKQSAHIKPIRKTMSESKVEKQTVSKHLDKSLRKTIVPDTVSESKINQNVSKRLLIAHRESAQANIKQQNKVKIVPNTNLNKPIRITKSEAVIVNQNEPITANKELKQLSDNAIVNDDESIIQIAAQSKISNENVIANKEPTEDQSKSSDDIDSNSKTITITSLIKPAIVTKIDNPSMPKKSLSRQEKNIVQLSKDINNELKATSSINQQCIEKNSSDKITDMEIDKVVSTQSEYLFNKINKSSRKGRFNEKTSSLANMSNKPNPKKCLSEILRESVKTNSKPFDVKIEENKPISSLPIKINSTIVTKLENVKDFKEEKQIPTQQIDTAIGKLIQNKVDSEESLENVESKPKLSKSTAGLKAISTNSLQTIYGNAKKLNKISSNITKTDLVSKSRTYLNKSQVPNNVYVNMNTSVDNDSNNVNLTGRNDTSKQNLSKFELQNDPSKDSVIIANSVSETKSQLLYIEKDHYAKVKLRQNKAEKPYENIPEGIITNSTTVTNEEIKANEDVNFNDVKEKLQRYLKIKPNNSKQLDKLNEVEQNITKPIKQCSLSKILTQNDKESVKSNIMINDSEVKQYPNAKSCVSVFYDDVKPETKILQKSTDTKSETKIPQKSKGLKVAKVTETKKSVTNANVKTSTVSMIQDNLDNKLSASTNAIVNNVKSAEKKKHIIDDTSSTSSVINKVDSDDKNLVVLSKEKEQPSVKEPNNKKPNNKSLKNINFEKVQSTINVKAKPSEVRIINDNNPSVSSIPKKNKNATFLKVGVTSDFDMNASTVNTICKNLKSSQRKQNNVDDILKPSTITNHEENTHCDDKLEIPSRKSASMPSSNANLITDKQTDIKQSDQSISIKVNIIKKQSKTDQKSESNIPTKNTEEINITAEKNSEKDAYKTAISTKNSKSINLTPEIKYEHKTHKKPIKLNRQSEKFYTEQEVSPKKSFTKLENEINKLKMSKLDHISIINELIKKEDIESMIKPNRNENFIKIDPFFTNLEELEVKRYVDSTPPPQPIVPEVQLCPEPERLTSNISIRNECPYARCFNSPVKLFTNSLWNWEMQAKYSNNTLNLKDPMQHKTSLFKNLQGSQLKNSKSKPHVRHLFNKSSDLKNQAAKTYRYETKIVESSTGEPMKVTYLVEEPAKI